MHKDPLKSTDLDFCGVLFGIKVEKREDASPLIHLYIEDDEAWHYKCSFDCFWGADLATMASVCRGLWKTYLKEK